MCSSTLRKGRCLCPVRSCWSGCGRNREVQRKSVGRSVTAGAGDRQLKIPGCRMMPDRSLSGLILALSQSLFDALTTARREVCAKLRGELPGLSRSAAAVLWLSPATLAGSNQICQSRFWVRWVGSTRSTPHHDCATSARGGPVSPWGLQILAMR
jgi:hypothetical protein